jgi:group I intron endonuclease
MTVYLITNLINGKQYVGQTIMTIERRWHGHTCRTGGCTVLYAAISKYGKENFKIESIYEASSLEELSAKEKELIKSLNTLAPNGYNLTTGGERPVFCEESREKMSKAKMGIPTWNKGKTKEDPRVDRSTKAARKALKEKFGDVGPNTGHKWDDEGRKKAAERMTGNVLSKETKKKMSDSHVKTKILCVELNKTYDSIMDASRDLKINSGQICHVLNGKYKQAKGYTFKRV